MTAMEYPVRVSKKYRRISVRLSATGEIYIASPKAISSRQKTLILAQAQDWITAHSPREVLKSLSDGCNVQIFGETEQLRFFPAIKGVSEVIETQREIQVFALEGEHRNILRGWLREVAQNGIIARTEELSATHGFKFTRINVRDQASRWGSCSSIKALSFSWRLIFAPMEVLDYVIIHELAHTLEMNHSHRFWSIVERCLPDYRSSRHWLKQNSRQLHNY